jgi:hypothetical protein
LGKPLMHRVAAEAAAASTLGWSWLTLLVAASEDGVAAVG